MSKLIIEAENREVYLMAFELSKTETDTSDSSGFSWKLFSEYRAGAKTMSFAKFLEGKK
jgi:hypothetical protein